MPRSRSSLHVVALLCAAFLLCGPASALAHKQGVRLAIGPVAGNASPIQIHKAGELVIKPFGGGLLELDLKDLRDGTGVKQSAPGNTLRMSMRVNGVPATVSQPFDVREGKTSLRTTMTPGQQLFKGDLVEIIAVDLFDQGGVRFATMGASPGTRTPVITSSLIYVTDSTSPIRFSRGGDTRLKLRDDGNFNSGFDTLLDPSGKEITHPGVIVELQLVRNGVPELHSYSYDIRRGRSVPNGRPVVHLGLQITDNVEVQRLDVFDNTHTRFSTLGIKIAAPKRRAP
jgi:hypothetical protein